MKKWLRKAKAVSPIIATLLMIVISVVAAVMLYGWVSTFMTTGIPTISTPYPVTIVDITTVASGGVPFTNAATYAAGNWTTLKVVITNPGAKVIDLTTDNIRLKTGGGEDILSANSTTSWIIYNMTTTWQTGSNTTGGFPLNGTTANAGLKTDTTASVTLDLGKTTTFYVQVATNTNGVATGTVGRALPKGEACTFTLIGALTRDGAPVVAQETMFKVTK